MSDVFDGAVAKQLLDAIAQAVNGSFVTMVCVLPGGQELARFTTVVRDGYLPCWQTTVGLALATTAGRDLYGLSKDFQQDLPRDDIVMPRSDGVGLRLFKSGQVVGGIGLLGLTVAEAVTVILEAAIQLGFTVAEQRS